MSLVWSDIPILNLGLVRYGEALKQMESLHSEIATSAFPLEGVILVVEHPPVVTMGKRETSADVLVTSEYFASHGIDFHHIDRGGSVTVHEPGQAVVYPLIKLHPIKLGARAYVSLLENSMKAFCESIGIHGTFFDPQNPGLWLGNDKLGAIGVRVAQSATKHGLAFNVCNDLSTFRAIVPCGLRGKGVENAQRALAARGVSLEIQANDAGLRLAHLIRKVVLNLRKL
jgi:lipoate-protein ligase B